MIEIEAFQFWAAIIGTGISGICGGMILGAAMVLGGGRR